MKKMSAKWFCNVYKHFYWVFIKIDILLKLLGFIFKVNAYFSSNYRDLLEKLLLNNWIWQIVQSKTLQKHYKMISKKLYNSTGSSTCINAMVIDALYLHIHKKMTKIV